MHSQTQHEEPIRAVPELPGPLAFGMKYGWDCDPNQ